MTGFFPAPKPTPTVKPPKAMRQRNKARHASEFARTMGSRARQKFVTSMLGCAACGSAELCDNAHVVEHEDGSEKGAGYKGSYREIAPLCRPRLENGEAYEGCHRFLHRAPAEFKAKYPAFNPIKAARETERR